MGNLAHKVKVEFQRLIGIDHILEREAATQDVYIPASQKHKEIFEKYKAIYRNKDVVLVATGPTLQYYEPIENAIHIAINNSITRDDIRFDYFFSSDYGYDGDKELFDFVYENRTDVVKFYMYNDIKRDHNLIPMRYRLQENVENYYAESFNWTTRGFFWDKRDLKFIFPLDLSISPLKSYGTTAFLAAQFALWTYPRRLYLGGTDCSTGKTKGLKFLNENEKCDFSFVIKPWGYFAEFARDVYDDVEIISINPVGLRGLFKDAYTEEYKNQYMSQ